MDQWHSLLAEQASLNGRLFFHLAHCILGNPAVAEDACQQAFLKALEQRQTIRDTKSIQGWLMRIVTNEALQLLRRRKLEIKVVHDDLLPLPGMAEVSAGQILPMPAEEMLALLRDEVRPVVVMRVIQGLTGNETASRLGLSTAEVSRRYHEGMELMRRAFNRHS